MKPPKQMGGKFSLPQAILAKQCCFMIIILLTTLIINNAKAADNKLSIDGTEVETTGWTEVTKKWPLDQSEGYFITVIREHSSIEVKVPSNLTLDLNVKLEFYFSFARVRPTLQAVACTKNLDVLDDYLALNSANRWTKHEMIVDKADCAKRNEIAYNVLLHDADDVFAWRLMKITPRREPFITEDPEADYLDNTIEEEIIGPSTSSSTTSTTSTTTTTPAPTAPTTTTTTRAPATTTSTTTTRAPIPTSTTTTRAPTTTSTTTTTTIAPTTTSTTTGAPTSTSTTTEPPSSTNQSHEVDINEPESSSSPTSSENSPPSNDQYWNDEDDRKVVFQRRALESGGDAVAGGGEQETIVTCTPKSCDRSLFRMKNFIIFIAGIPKLPRNTDLNDTKNNLYLSGNSQQPINFVARSSDHDFTDVNACFNVKLFMDPGTEFEFLIDDETVAGSKKRLLELIKKSNDTWLPNNNNDQWELFERCLDDYMPRLQPSSMNDKHKLNLTFLPKKTIGGKQVAILADSERSIYLLNPHQIQQYIPNINIVNNQSSFNKYWVLSSDSRGSSLKPRVNQVSKTIDPSTSTDVKVRNVLRISNIDPKQETFDITTRWLKVDDVETLENSMLTSYHVDKPDWLQSTELNYQNAANQNNEWTTLELFDSQTTTPNTSSSLPGETESGNTVIQPFKLKKLTQDEFRFRFRHHIKPEARLASRPLELDINSLSFGDVCASTNGFCKNNGSCKPTGPAQASCQCQQGFSGTYCETIKPCDVIYGDQTGHDLCKSIGANCIDGLTELRCIWPNDRLFDCKPLFPHRIDNATGLIIPTTSMPSGNNTSGSDEQPQPAASLSDQVEKLTEQTNSLTQLIIILVVFIVAMALFTIVIIVNLISRLMKSKKHLREAKNENHELARRSQPSGSGFNRLNGQRNLIKQSPAAYNNQAFDTN